MTAIEDGASQEGVHRDSLGHVQESRIEIRLEG
jgi:hypothetical protein